VRSTGQREGNTENDFKDIRTQNGSNQSQILALTGVFVPSSRDSGKKSVLLSL